MVSNMIRNRTTIFSTNTFLVWLIDGIDHLEIIMKLHNLLVELNENLVYKEGTPNIFRSSFSFSVALALACMTCYMT